MPNWGEPLIDSQVEKFCFVNRAIVPDGEGGQLVEWSEGAEFEALARFDSSMQAKIAEKQGVTSLYTIITKKNVVFQHLDVIRRLKDGKLFRITSDGQDDQTPKGAGIQLRKASAEEWEIPR